MTLIFYQITYINSMGCPSTVERWQAKGIKLNMITARKSNSKLAMQIICWKLALESTRKSSKYIPTKKTKKKKLLKTCEK